MNANTIGLQIKALRLQKGITQEALAESLGVTFQTISKWENAVTMPDILMLPQIAVYFGVSVDALFSLTTDARMERIENMLTNVRVPSEEAFAQAEVCAQIGRCWK